MRDIIDVKVGEKYPTVCGKLVRITAILDGECRVFPIIGEILDDDTNTVPGTVTFTAKGKYNVSGNHGYDLVIDTNSKDVTRHKCRCPRENFQFIGGGCKGCKCGGI